ncbi:glutaredoxin [Halospina denitrificans]|uniref:Glutaredoxin n=1 Tax=Halospina denitrificans TaxID=332522 RepID=A0A4R7K1Y9_9GAMM|nr:DUF4124 domain-containing protein [Halospina denitrificans]TDT44384.1 glutaredoxin [Halospina denitrificans]
MARIHWPLLLLLLAAVSASADIYKSVDEDGNVSFSDSATDHSNPEKVEMSGLNSIQSPETRTGDELIEHLSPDDGSVVMYSASWCGVCDKARDYFVNNDIPFREYDVEERGRGKHDYRKLDADGVPVILHDDQRLDGFSAGSFEAMYRD